MRTTSDVPKKKALLVALLMVSAVTLAAGLAAAEELNRIVLRVNDQILTLHDYQQRKAAAVSAVLANPNLSTRDQQERLGRVGPMVMQQLFQELLLSSRAKQLRILVTDDQVEAAIMDMAKSQGIEDQASLRQALASSGMTLEQLRENTRRDMMFQQVVGREVTSKIEVPEEEMRAFYRENKERFTTPEERWLKEVIVLEEGGSPPEELARLAAEIRGKLLEGGEFEAVIEPYKAAGITTGVIDLDWLEKSELTADLAEVAFELEPGAYSEGVPSRGGLHILHLAGLREAELKPFSEVEDRILGYERSRRYQKELQDFLAELERSAFVREDLPSEAVGFRSLAAEYTSDDEIDVFRQPVLPAKEEEEEETGEEEGEG